MPRINIIKAAEPVPYTETDIVTAYPSEKKKRGRKKLAEEDKKPKMTLEAKREYMRDYYYKHRGQLNEARRLCKAKHVAEKKDVIYINKIKERLDHDEEFKNKLFSN
jgi:hypothetical protein